MVAQRISPFISELPRAELTVANVLLSLGHFSDAKNHFESANNEYRKRTILGTDWYAAVDGLAVVYDLTKEFREAHNKAERDQCNYLQDTLRRNTISQKLKKTNCFRYTMTSALYTEYGDELVKNFCFYERSLFQSSMQQYDKLLDKNPDFLVAYRKIGTMLLNRSISIRLTRCSVMSGSTRDRKCDEFVRNIDRGTRCAEARQDIGSGRRGELASVRKFALLLFQDPVSLRV